MKKIAYPQGTVVWAQVRGCPWWPALSLGPVKDYPTKIIVNFIGENSHAEVPLNKVQSFDEGYRAHGQTKSCKLLDSIKAATNIHRNLSTFAGMQLMCTSIEEQLHWLAHSKACLSHKRIQPEPPAPHLVPRKEDSRCLSQVLCSMDPASSAVIPETGAEVEVGEANGRHEGECNQTKIDEKANNVKDESVHEDAKDEKKHSEHKAQQEVQCKSEPEVAQEEIQREGEKIHPKRNDNGKNKRNDNNKDKGNDSLEIKKQGKPIPTHKGKKHRMLTMKAALSADTNILTKGGRSKLEKDKKQSTTHKVHKQHQQKKYNRKIVKELHELLRAADVKVIAKQHRRLQTCLHAIEKSTIPFEALSADNLAVLIQNLSEYAQKEQALAKLRKPVKAVLHKLQAVLWNAIFGHSHKLRKLDTELAYGKPFSPDSHLKDKKLRDRAPPYNLRPISAHRCGLHKSSKGPVHGPNSSLRAQPKCRCPFCEDSPGGLEHDSRIGRNHEHWSKAENGTSKADSHSDIIKQSGNTTRYQALKCAHHSHCPDSSHTRAMLPLLLRIHLCSIHDHCHVLLGFETVLYPRNIAV